MLEYRRYRDAAADLAELLRRRSAATSTARRRCRPSCAASRSTPPRQAYEPERLGVALGDLLRTPPRARHQPHPPDRLARAAAAASCASCSRSDGTLDFDEAFGGEDRLTQAVTLFALLELYKRGEATWKQERALRPDRGHGHGRGERRTASGA